MQARTLTIRCRRVNRSANLPLVRLGIHGWQEAQRVYYVGLLAR